MSRHRIDLSPQHKRRLDAFAVRQGQSSAGILRALIERLPDAPELAEQPAAEPRTGPIKIRMTENECAEINRRARAAGMTGRATWVAALIRANLQSETVFTEDEINELRAAYRQLAHIGGNLNQIAHALNIDTATAERPSDRLLRDLMQQVDAVRDELAAVFRAASRRWKL